MLEAFAQGTAVITTSVGVRGLAAISGRHLLVADTATDFARAILRALDAPLLRQGIGEAARQVTGIFDSPQELNRVLTEVATTGKAQGHTRDYS